MAKYNIDHFDLLDIGTNNHFTIDDHINSSHNPHGSTLTLSTIEVNTVNGEVPANGVVVDSVRIQSGNISNSDGSTPIVCPDGLQCGPTNNILITFFFSYTMTNVAASIYPFATACTDNFYFRCVNNAVFMMMNTQNVISATTNNFIVYSGLVPAPIRPPSDIAVIILVANGGARVPGTITVSHATGDVTLGVGSTPTAYSSSGTAGYYPMRLFWTI